MKPATSLTTPSSAQIEAQIRLARDHKSNLEDEARDLSLPAVSGNDEAAESLAKVQVQLHQVNADIVVLENAKVAAVGKELAEADIKAAAYRAHHLAVAKAHAAEIVQLAGRADAMVADLKAVIVDMRAVERSIWLELREASAPPSDAIVGRKSLDGFVIESVHAMINGSNNFRDQRAVADVAKNAWSHLLVTDGGDDV